MEDLIDFSDDTTSGKYLRLKHVMLQHFVGDYVFHIIYQQDIVYRVFLC